jgi:hypothetical protein
MKGKGDVYEWRTESMTPKINVRLN